MFFTDIVKEKIETEFPELEYAAALIGQGSEVLGFDDEMSTDHHWGPRLQIFLKEENYDKYHFLIKEFFKNNLPSTFLGYSTNWSEPDPNDSMNQFLELKEEGSINHRIEIYTVKQYLEQFLALESSEIDEIDWLTVPEQKLLEFTSGKVFHDSIGDLTRAREHLRYYPDSIRKLKIITQWDRISQEMVFVGRTGGREDDLGSRIEASRLVKYIIEMAYVLEKKYIPYEKWFALAFKQLEIAPSLEPILLKILRENQWQQRQMLLCDAYLILVNKLVDLELIHDHKITKVQFYNRPQLIVPLNNIIKDLKDGMKFSFNPIIYQLGTINQLISVCNNLNPRFCKRAQIFFK